MRTLSFILCDSYCMLPQRPDSEMAERPCHYEESVNLPNLHVSPFITIHIVEIVLSRNINIKPTSIKLIIEISSWHFKCRATNRGLDILHLILTHITSLLRAMAYRMVL